MKLLKYILFPSFFLLWTLDGQAQYDRYFYNWSNRGDIESVTTNVPGEVVFKSWESNSFLFEYHIRISNVPRATFLALLKTGRYRLQEEHKDRNLHLFVDKGAFRIFVSDVGQAQEDVVLTIYYPEEYVVNGEQVILK